MKNTIIAIYGRAAEGKSSTIKRVVEILKANYPVTLNYLINGDDVLVTIQLGNVKIGIESQGDPKSRMLTEHTVERLAAQEKCNIIVCATRTRSDTVHEVDRIAETYKYATIWKSSYYTGGHLVMTVNQIAAEEIVKLIEAIIAERLN